MLTHSNNFDPTNIILSPNVDRYNEEKPRCSGASYNCVAIKYKYSNDNTDPLLIETQWFTFESFVIDDANRNRYDKVKVVVSCNKCNTDSNDLYKLGKSMDRYFPQVLRERNWSWFIYCNKPCCRSDGASIRMNDQKNLEYIPLVTTGEEQSHRNFTMTTVLKKHSGTFIVQFPVFVHEVHNGNLLIKRVDNLTVDNLRQLLIPNKTRVKLLIDVNKCWNNHGKQTCGVSLGIEQMEIDNS